MMKIKKWLQLSMLGAAIGLSAMALGACSKVPEGYTGFVEGYDNEVVLGEEMSLDEYIDFVQLDPETGEWELSLFDSTYKYAEYTLTLSKGDTVIDLTGKTYWEIGDEASPGDWTLTYQITEKCDYKGKFTAPLKIVAPKITATYTDDESVTTQYFGSTMNFESFFSGLNMDIRSYFDYTVKMKDVFLAPTKTNLTNETEYKFPRVGGYNFTFVIESEDGQTLEKTILVKCVYKNIGKKTVYLRSTDTGTLDIDVGSAVTNVQMNKKAFDAYTPATNGLSIAYSELHKYPGLNEVSFAMASGVYCSYTVEVITEHIAFDENGMPSAFGVGYYRPGDKGYMLLQNWETHEWGGDGNYVMGTDKASGSATVYFTINQAYVDFAFADPNVDYIEFEVYAACQIQLLRSSPNDPTQDGVQILDNYVYGEELTGWDTTKGYGYKLKMYRDFFYKPIAETHLRDNEHSNVPEGCPVADSVFGERYRVILSGLSEGSWTPPAWFYVDNFKLGFDA